MSQPTWNSGQAREPLQELCREGKLLTAACGSSLRAVSRDVKILAAVSPKSDGERNNVAGKSCQ